LTHIYSSSSGYDYENVWWKDGLTFGCTGCGRCCQNEGEVWFDTDEVYDLCELLNMSHEQVLDRYAESIITGWVKVKSKDASDTACVFLGKNNNCII
jgi:Fe-S-cluster containining protein